MTNSLRTYIVFLLSSFLLLSGVVWAHASSNEPSNEGFSRVLHEEQNYFTLIQAIEWAYKNNRSFQVVKQETDLANKKLAYNDIRRPTVSFTSTPLRVSGGELQEPDAQLQARYNLTADARIDINLSLSQIREDVNVDTRVTATYSTKLFEPVAAGSSQQSQVSSADERLENSKNRLIMDVAKAYYSVVKQDQRVQLLSEELVFAIKRYERLSIQNQSEADILRAEGDVDEAKHALENAKEALVNFKVELAGLMEISDYASLILDHTPIYMPLEKGVEFWVQEGISVNSQVNEQKKRVIDAQEKLYEAMADHGWDISFNVSYDWRLNNSMSPGSKGQGDLRSSIVVQRSLYPQDPFKIDELELSLINAELSLEAAIKRGERDVEAAYRSTIILEDRIYNLEERLENAKESLMRTEKMIEAGLATGLDRFDIELLLKGIQLDLSHAMYDHQLARWELVIMCGLPIPEFIHGGDPL